MSLGEAFNLEKGQVLTIPEGVVLLVPKILPDGSEKTQKLKPWYTVLDLKSDGRFCFSKGDKGKRLFLPEVKAGDEIMISWVDDNCACAELAVN